MTGSMIDQCSSPFSLMSRSVVLSVTLAAVVCLGATRVGAQDTKPAAKPAAATVSPGEGGLRARVESLEEQLVDMQVVVGTLESLAKGGGAAASSRPMSVSGSGADSARVAALEEQIRQLNAQVQSLSDQVRGSGARRPDTVAVTPPAMTGGGFGATGVSSTNVANAQIPNAPTSDAIGGLITGDAAPLPPIPNAAGDVSTAALPPAGDGADPKQLYETAYGYLLQRDYGSAETAFSDFLTRFPQDSLSGNAQYWLGESHFVRGQYKAAAASFLKGYQTYASSPKAPDSLLKLAMSLDRLGQKDAACSSYAELGSKFPNAPQSVKTRAQAERQRVGCS